MRALKHNKETTVIISHGIEGKKYGKNKVDIVGNKYADLIVISEAYTKNGHIFWNCLCKCGNTKAIDGTKLKNGHTKSCGCLKAEIGAHLIHGKTGTPEHRIWAHMRQRCDNPSDHAYENYGGRGITVCRRWNDFENFLADMGERPNNNYSIERKDVNGNYEPANCVWDTPVEQARNQRVSKLNKTGCSGVARRTDTHLEKYRAGISVDYKKIDLGTYDNYMDAVFVRKVAEALYWGKIYKPEY